jgi:hypothetical protein
MDRLYRAADELGKVTGQSNVARKLNESPQTVKNWETRGISDAGAIKAEGILGCLAHWLTTGEGDMLGVNSPTATVKDSLSHQPPSMDEALLVVLDAMAVAPQRDKLRTALLAVLDDDAPAYRQRLAELLQATTPARAQVWPTRDAA